jgi:protein TonB
MRFTERHFYSALFISLFVHFFVLTVLITNPPVEKPPELKELRIKLGVKKADLSAASHDISENLYFKQQPAPAIVQQFEPASSSDTRKVIAGDTNDSEKEAAEQLAKTQEAINENAQKQLPENEEVKTLNFTEKKPENNTAEKKPAKEAEKIMESALKNRATAVADALPPPQPLARAMAAQGDGALLGNSTDKDAEDLTSYEQMLPLWLDKFKVYPDEARASGIEGRGDIFIKIDRNGKVLLSKVIKSTGHAELDKALMKMIEDADPVIPVPPEYHEDKKTFSYKITFEFRN